MAIEIDRGHEKYDVVFGRAVIKAHAVANDYGCAEITWHAPGGATTPTRGAIAMTFDEWLESYFSGTQIDDVVTGMMRTAFDAGRCEAGAVGLRDKFAEMTDSINPSHYRKGDVECVDAIKAATVGKTGIEAVCTANVIKYVWRYEEKNGVEDLRKARWYLDRLIKEVIEK